MKPTKVLMEKIGEALETIDKSGEVSIMIDASGKYVDIVIKNRERVPLPAEVVRIYK